MDYPVCTRASHNRSPAEKRLSRKRRQLPESTKPSETAFTSIDRWLGSRHRYVLLVIVIISVGTRVVCLLELRQSPLFSMHRWDQSDMN